MRISPKITVTLGMTIGATVFLQTQSVTAFSADLAKKCRDLAIKVSEGQRAYFKYCVAKGGNMSADHQTSDPSPPNQASRRRIGPN